MATLRERRLRTSSNKFYPDTTSTQAGQPLTLVSIEEKGVEEFEGRGIPDAVMWKVNKWFLDILLFQARGKRLF